MSFDRVDGLGHRQGSDIDHTASACQQQVGDVNARDVEVAARRCSGLREDVEPSGSINAELTRRPRVILARYPQPPRRHRSFLGRRDRRARPSTRLRAAPARACPPARSRRGFSSRAVYESTPRSRCGSGRDWKADRSSQPHVRGRQVVATTEDWSNPCPGGNFGGVLSTTPPGD